MNFDSTSPQDGMALIGWMLSDEKKKLDKKRGIKCISCENIVTYVMFNNHKDEIICGRCYLKAVESIDKEQK